MAQPAGSVRGMAPSIAQQERAALCDLLLELGPDAPTLCEGWTTADMAAHLVVRERRPDAAPGILLPPFSGWTTRVMEGEKARGLDAMVQTLRSGPPPPLSLVDSLINTQEYVIHHEDVRRANGMGPREGIDDVQAAIAQSLRRQARLLARGMGDTGLVLVLPNGETITAHGGEPAANLIGPPVELALYLTGRKDAAVVEMEGQRDKVETLRNAKLGL